MAYRYGNRHQMTLLPKSIEDYVGAEDPVSVYDENKRALKELIKQCTRICMELDLIDCNVLFVDGDISIPSLHSPYVPAIVPSASISASSMASFRPSFHMLLFSSEIPLSLVIVISYYYHSNQ